MKKTNKALRKILVAIDFSDASEFAIIKAIELAKVYNAKITFLHIIEKKSVDEVLDKYLGKLLPGSLWLNTEEYYQNLLHEKVTQLVHHNVDIETMIIPKGNPPVKILSYAHKYKFDLLIIGAHGKHLIRDTFVGTTAEYIADKAKCPVLIVKNKPVKPYKKILVAIDFSHASKCALDSAMQLFPKSEVEILHVGDYEYASLLKKEEDEESIAKSKLNKINKAIIFYLEDKLKKFVKSIRKTQIKFTRVILGYPAPIIVNESEKKKSNLIAMGTQGHGKMHYLFLGKVAHVVLRETTKDILLVPPKK